MDIIYKLDCECSYWPISLAVWETKCKDGGYIGIITRFWETAHLPLPNANINTQFLLREKFDHYDHH